MEPQERDLITTLLTRLESASKAGQPKDPEADALIRQAMTQMPDAPYYLVQTVLIQDLSLHNAQNRIAELEQQLAAAASRNSAPAFSAGFSAAASNSRRAACRRAARGHGRRKPRLRRRNTRNRATPRQPGYAPTGGGMFSGGGGGFLRSAAATAAGVAGGALLFQGISILFGHSYASGLGGFAAG